MTRPRISVALCTYNGAAYLGEQLASIGAQTVRPDEIVVGDDGSTDDTSEMLARAMTILPQLRLLPVGDHDGVRANFERTIADTKGDVVFLSDQDDVWHPERIAQTLLVFAADPAIELVHSNARLIDGTGASNGDSLLDRLGVDHATRTLLKDGEAFDTMLRRNVVTGATVAVRRSLVERSLPFPTSWLHDEWLAIMAASQGTGRLLDTDLIDYRLHGGNEVGAQRMTLTVRLSRLTEGRTSRNARLLSRARALHDRLPSGPERDAVADKVTHEEIRSSYPAPRIARIPAILRESRTGRYSRFGRGVDDLVRDLLQPAR